MNRKFDNVGRMVVPMEMRKAIGVDKPGSEVLMQLVNNKIIISNPNLNDKFGDWLKDEILRTEDDNLKYIYDKYMELK